jgi:hypothetical protein
MLADRYFERDERGYSGSPTTERVTVNNEQQTLGNKVIYAKQNLGAPIFTILTSATRPRSPQETRSFLPP